MLKCSCVSPWTNVSGGQGQYRNLHLVYNLILIVSPRKGHLLRHLILGPVLPFLSPGTVRSSYIWYVVLFQSNKRCCGCLGPNQCQIDVQVENHAVTIVVGETGSGKTTQIPQFLLGAGWCADGYQVCCSFCAMQACYLHQTRPAYAYQSVLCKPYCT